METGTRNVVDIKLVRHSRFLLQFEQATGHTRNIAIPCTWNACVFLLKKSMNLDNEQKRKISSSIFRNFLRMFLFSALLWAEPVTVLHYLLVQTKRTGSEPATWSGSVTCITDHVLTSFVRHCLLLRFVVIISLNFHFRPFKCLSHEPKKPKESHKEI